MILTPVFATEGLLDPNTCVRQKRSQVSSRAGQVKFLGALQKEGRRREAAPQQQLSQTSSITAGRCITASPLSRPLDSFFTSSRHHRAVAGLHYSLLRLPGLHYSPFVTHYTPPDPRTMTCISRRALSPDQDRQCKSTSPSLRYRNATFHSFRTTPRSSSDSWRHRTTPILGLHTVCL